MPSQPTPIEMGNLYRKAATPKLLSGLVTDMVDSKPKKKPPTCITSDSLQKRLLHVIKQNNVTIVLHSTLAI